MPRLSSVTCLSSFPYNTLSVALDVSVFHRLKHACLGQVKVQHSKGERGVWKDKLLNSAQLKAFTSANILSGFRYTRLWLVDLSVVRDCMKSGSWGVSETHISATG